MKLLPKITAAILLLFNGMGAMYGGLNLITSPNGDTLGLSVRLLTYTPFDSFIIPGIVLLIANGLPSVFALAAILSSYEKWAGMALLQGAILIAWILVQVILIRTVNVLHAVLVTVGIILILIGYFENAHLRRDSLILRQKRRLEKMEH